MTHRPETDRRTRLAAVWPPTAEAAATAGHKPMSPVEAIRQKCLDCAIYQPSEIRACEALKCPLWPFRAGKHPYTAAARKKAAQGASFEAGEVDEA